MATSVIEKYERDYQSLKSTIERYDYIIALFKEFDGQASMVLDVTVVRSEEEEDEFNELGDFILDKLQSLRKDLFR
jgi:hypothetical protein